MSIRLTLPIGISLHDWADQVSLELDPYGSFGRLDGEDWQNWAVQFLNNSKVGANLPNPYMFDKWQHWADRFCEATQ